MVFKKNNFLEIRVKRPNTINVNKEVIKKIVRESGIKNTIVNISSPITWVMQLQKIYLDDGRCLILKIGVIPEWSDTASINNQIQINNILSAMGILQPKILNYSDKPDPYGFLFILSDSQKGKKLYEIYDAATEKDRDQIYAVIGNAYSMIHEKQNDWAGIWNGDPSMRKYPIHPADFYLNAELKNGGGKYLLDYGLIDINVYDDICRIWENNLSNLKNRPNSLIHGSPFPWSIYLTKEHDSYSISGFSAYGDFMWWDKMVDVTHLLYPPFMEISTNAINSFTKNYKHFIDEKVINFYLLLARICTMTGCYLAPIDKQSADKWIKHELKALKDLINRMK